MRLSSLQISLYQQYLDKFTSASSLTSDGPGSKFVCPGLFSDYHSLMHIWTHPYVLRLDEIRQEKKVGSSYVTPEFSASLSVVSVLYDTITAVMCHGNAVYLLGHWMRSRVRGFDSRLLCSYIMTGMLFTYVTSPGRKVKSGGKSPGEFRFLVLFSS